MRQLIALFTLIFAIQTVVPADLDARGKRSKSDRSSRGRDGGSRRLSKDRTRQDSSGWDRARSRHRTREKREERERNPKVDQYYQKRQERRTGRSEQRGERRDERSGRRDERRETRGERRDERRETRVGRREEHRHHRTERREHRRKHVREVRRDFRKHHYVWHDHWHGYHHSRGWYYYDRGDWWVPATFGFVAGWFTAAVLRDQEPVRYIDDSGSDVIYIEGDLVIVNGEVIGTTDEYAEEAEDLANSVPNVDPSTLELAPLGVWALSQSTDSSGSPIMYLQLAVSKEGIVAGMYQNTFLRSVESVEGMTDMRSQRVAWTIVGKDSPVMETTIGDLTSRDGVAKLLMHFSDGTTQEWTMVRLDKDELPQS